MRNIQDLSEIQKFYRDATVFITGSTGFVGKLILEKVLRSLPVKKVIVLVRDKKNVPAEQRFKDIFVSPCFDPIRKIDPELLNKATMVKGECNFPELGLSPEDKETFLNEVDVIFHCAAVVKFDMPIKQATNTNIIGTKELLQLAKQLKHLKVFVYVSTAYANANRHEIKEEVYVPKISAEKLITACESLDESLLDHITAPLIDDWPNTYTFTKQITEDYINRNSGGLPMCIARPSIVCSTAFEPLPSFVDSVISVAGFNLAYVAGLIRISYIEDIVIDLIPVDIVVNECIAAGWSTGESFSVSKGSFKVPVYNVCSGHDNPLKQMDFYGLNYHYGTQYPFPSLKMYPLFFLTTSKYAYLFWRFVFHTMMAYIADVVAKIFGKTTNFTSLVNKIHKFQETYEFFCTNEFFFHTGNTHKLVKKMSSKDRILFNCDITTVNWVTYLSSYFKGVRVYLLKEPLTEQNLKEGDRVWKRKRMEFVLFLFAAIIILYVLLKIALFRIVPAAFSVIGSLLRFIFSLN